MTVVGLGIEGIDLVRFLAGEGARVTVSDRRQPADLTEALAAIEECDVTLSLGANRPEDAATADVLFVSQGVPSDNPAVEAAVAAGVPISSMLGLFLERCPAPVTGITGSSGKTTTTALVGAMLEAEGLDHVVGGNIGVGLLSLLPSISPETRVVAEISHSQLERVSASPHVACVTNVTPNHLDRYSWEDYVALKRRIVQFQTPDDTSVFNLDNEVSRAFSRDAPGRVVTTSMREAIAGDGAMMDGDALVRVRGSARDTVATRGEVALRGEHNLENLLSAIAVGAELGVSAEAAARVARSFAGVPHRLEPVATVGGVLYVNDSIATAPERTLAGLRAFGERVVLLLGGRDKNLPVEEMAAEAARRCRAVITFGESGNLYARAMHAAPGSGGVTVRQVQSVEEAVQAAAALAQAGDVVLFSPAATSFDQYPNFEIRGRAFRDAVHGLEGAR
ncbi:MAG: UDP-N-acetylmuramoyl-L-alanine--D-glutamate ligase [Chloroflexi bacterium]|nr:UDP-N-acetylmuramoyl-L-alanine--D-glutamate ligase [Chloroflexota bacterium]MDA1240714.1 UDP-N-acetylmuramoyl-L-alanine--D-glutamate ligase [Chloroflexota bacterium]